jgi:peroxiredoxin
MQFGALMTPLAWSAAILLGIVLAVILAAVYHLIVQNGRLLLRLESLERQLREQGIPVADADHPLPAGIPEGTLLNDFALRTLEGGTARLSQLSGKRLLLVFVSPGCAFCETFLEELGKLPKNGPAMPLFVSRGSPEENRALFERHGVAAPVLLQEDAEVSSLFRIPGTPAGFLVDENRTTASGMLVGTEPLLKALGGSTAAKGGKFSRSLEESKILRDGLKAGVPAPDFTLPSLDGPEISLKDYRGRKLLLVFSDPQCGPCNAVAPDLERVHRRGRGPAILMISRGDVEANRRKAAEHGVSFPIVLQRHWEISRAYGMFATPIAYRIDEHGFIDKGVAVGAGPILELADQI